MELSQNSNSEMISYYAYCFCFAVGLHNIELEMATVDVLYSGPHSILTDYQAFEIKSGIMVNLPGALTTFVLSCSLLWQGRLMLR